jgi:hypothetical protein
MKYFFHFTITGGIKLKRAEASLGTLPAIDRPEISIVSFPSKEPGLIRHAYKPRFCIAIYY